METLTALLALCGEKPPVKSYRKGLVTRDWVFFYVSQNN